MGRNLRRRVDDVGKALAEPAVQLVYSLSASKSAAIVAARLTRAGISALPVAGAIIDQVVFCINEGIAAELLKMRVGLGF